jgi:hypothetical protein
LTPPLGKSQKRKGREKVGLVTQKDTRFVAPWVGALGRKKQPKLIKKGICCLLLTGSLKNYLFFWVLIFVFSSGSLDL